MLVHQKTIPAGETESRSRTAPLSVPKAAHRIGSFWTTIEEPLALADAIRRAAPHFDRILVDCLTVWLGNFCWEHRDREARYLEAIASREISRLDEAATAADVIVVSNEVGCGIVPDNLVGRVFRDLQGALPDSPTARVQEETGKKGNSDGAVSRSGAGSRSFPPGSFQAPASPRPSAARAARHGGALLPSLRLP